jgi:hypothetical protein
MKPGWSNDTPQYYLDKGYTYEYLSNGFFLMEIGKLKILRIPEFSSGKREMSGYYFS